jgi:hypothetical protein
VQQLRLGEVAAQYTPRWREAADERLSFADFVQDSCSLNASRAARLSRCSRASVLPRNQGVRLEILPEKTHCTFNSLGLACAVP